MTNHFISDIHFAAIFSSDFVIYDREPNVTLILNPITPKMAAELFKNTNNHIEVNAKDLLSPFGAKQLTHVSRYE